MEDDDGSDDDGSDDDGCNGDNESIKELTVAARRNDRHLSRISLLSAEMTWASLIKISTYDFDSLPEKRNPAREVEGIEKANGDDGDGNDEEVIVEPKLARAIVD